VSQSNPIIARGLEDKVACMILAKHTDSSIGRELGISRQAVGRYRKQTTNLTDTKQLTGLKAIVRMEVSQENALSELSLQMADYTKEYKAALGEGQIGTKDRPIVIDTDAAHKWGALRLRCLEMMIKVTGLDKGIPQAPPAQTDLTQVPNAELEARILELIAAKRKS